MNDRQKWFSLQDSGWLALAFVLWLTMAGTPLAIVLVLQTMLSGQFNGYITYLALGVSELLLIAPLIVYMAWRRVPLRALLGSRPTAAQNLLGALLGVLLAGAVLGLNGIMDVLARRIGLPMPDTSYLEPTSWGLVLAGLIAVGGTAGIVEEPIFRGVVLRGMGAVGGRRWAILVSAAAFSLIHMDLIGAPTRFVVGVLLGLLTWRSGGILPSVLAHAGYNGATLLMAFAAKRYLPDFTSFSFLQALPSDGADILTAILLSLPFAAAVLGGWWLFCRVSPGRGWQDAPHLPRGGALTALPWVLLALVTVSITVTNTMLLWFMPQISEMFSGLGG